MKKHWVLFALAAAILLGIFSAYSQEDITTVEDGAFETRMRPPVPFVHDQHNENAEIESCNVCHHLYENGKRLEDDSSEGMECSECHLSENEKYPISLVKAYHLMCKGCHQQRKAGPVMCAECHPKN